MPANISDGADLSLYQYVEDNADAISKELYEEICKTPHKEQADKVLSGAESDIDPSFLGFIKTYLNLSKLIPLGCNVYDFGCCFGFQAWYFKRHKYHGIDMMPISERFTLENHKHYSSTIRNFLENTKIDQPSFAICNYVPPWEDDNISIIKKYFQNMYIYYPCKITKFKQIKEV
jgi:hypothetical protein